MIEVFMGKKGWFFRVKAKNGEIVAQSEGYTTELDAMRGAHGLIALFASTEMLVVTVGK